MNTFGDVNSLLQQNIKNKKLPLLLISFATPPFDSFFRALNLFLKS